MAHPLTSAETAALGIMHSDPQDDQGFALAPRSAFDLRYIASAIRSNLLLIGALIAASMALALIFTLLKTPRYTASAAIQINDTSGRVLASKEDSDVSAESNGYDIDRFLKTQVDIIQSRGLAQRVAQKLKLTSDPAFFAAQEIDPPGTSAPVQARNDLAVALLQGYLKVDLPRDSRIVTISYESVDPAYSAKVANAYASEFIVANLQRKFDSSAYARNFLSEQLADAKQRVEVSERALNAYARQAGLIRLATGSGDSSDARSSDISSNSVTTSSLTQANVAANDAKARRIIAESRWRSMSAAPLLGSSEVVSNATVSSLLGRKAEIEAALNEDKARHLQDYPSVRAKQSELSTINQQLENAARNVRNSVRSDYLAALEAERQLTNQVSQLKNETLGEQDLTVQYGLLSREADTNRQLYNGLLERYKTLNAMAGESLSNINIIDNAEIPKGPSSPNLFKNLLIGLIVGIGITAVAVFLKDQFDDSIRVPEDVEAKLSLPLLGVVPKSQSDDPDEGLSDPKSPISEAYNSLRGSLLYSTPEGLPQIMLVTSAQPAEGKSTSSHAIASGFARMGRKVLLIDADLRRPTLHRRVDLDDSKGLSTLLTSHDSLASAITPSGQDYLSFLPAGPIPPSPTELLSTARVEEVLQEAASMFDVVVIDSPPILGLADSPLLAALVDGVVFIVEAERSRRGSLKSSLRRLRAMRPVLLGAVLTKFNPLKAGNRYSEYYGYDYYQYESKIQKD